MSSECLEDIEFETRADIHELTVQREYFNKIRNGTKTVEGRAGKVDAKHCIHENYREGQTRFKVGDKLRFSISGDRQSMEEDSVTCQITKVVFHDTFEDMLSGSGLEKCLPGVASVKEGVQIYRGFCGYEQRETEFGVVGIHVKVL